jgi:hypothetical protein
MNSIIACSLIFDNPYQSMPDYILPYYAHCLRQFSMTMMGAFILQHRKFTVDSCKYLALEVYANEASIVCKTELNQLSKTLEGAFITYWRDLFRTNDLKEQLLILESETIPLYQRCVILGCDQSVTDILTGKHHLLVASFLGSSSSGLQQLREFMYSADSQLELVM